MYTEIKYLNLLSVRLEKFAKKKEYLWNCRCPICGDSHKNKTKARGFFFRHKSSILYKCHNCQISLPFPKVLEMMDGDLYKEYKVEKFKDSAKPRRDMRKVNRIVTKKPEFKIDVLSNTTPITSLNKSHPAREYLEKRRLPIEALYYTEKFKEWVNIVKPETFEDIRNDEPRIIIPFKDQKGNVFGFQGRSLSSTGLRYITILIDEERTKIFGLDHVDIKETVYVTEGPFDSLLVRNAVAMAGADVDDNSVHLGDRVVYVYDNEPRNAQITKRISKHIQDGHSVVIWPNHIKEKDINDMILAGYSAQDIIENNTFQGLTAQLQFNKWKK